MQTTVITPPAAIVTLEQAKAHLRVDDTSSDTRISALVAAETGLLDGPGGWLGRAIGTQTLEWSGDGFGCGRNVKLPFSPIASVTSVKYLDADGIEQTFLAPGQYSLVGGDVWLAPGVSWPTVGDYPNSVRIRYVAGYTTVPDAIKVAILEGVRAIFDGLSGPELDAVERLKKGLLTPYRIFA